MYNYICRNKDVAQWLNWIEQPPPKGQVAGSNPAWVTSGLVIYSRDAWGCAEMPWGLRVLERLFNIGLQPVKIERIKVTEPLHPGPGGLHGIGIEFAPFHPAVAFLLDQSGIAEHT